MNIFEFDDQKSLANLHKHGIDFHDAQERTAGKPGSEAHSRGFSGMGS
tara:strand:+ start:19611 stop:19754 length:144 start_codon:yes stop_codon:yes gene_type:complete